MTAIHVETGLFCIFLIYIKANEDKHMEGVVLIPDEKEHLSKDDDGSRYYNITNLATYNESVTTEWKRYMSQP